MIRVEMVSSFTVVSDDGGSYAKLCLYLIKSSFHFSLISTSQILNKRNCPVTGSTKIVSQVLLL